MHRAADGARSLRTKLDSANATSLTVVNLWENAILEIPLKMALDYVD